MKEVVIVKKAISSVLCVVLVVSLFSVSAFAAENPSAWAQTDVSNAISLGLVPQTLQSKYTQATTRAEFCSLAVALYEKVTGGVITGRVTFTDTNSVDVEKMAFVGVVNGTSPGKFTPNAQLTREQAATMLARLSDAIGKPFPKVAAAFADAGSISDWALEAVGRVQAAGIMNGTSPTNFSPKGPYTREQSIVTMLRMHTAMSTGDPGSPKMYASYPSVPDFGAFSGAKLVDTYTLKPSEGVGIIYLYDIKSTTSDKLNGYADLLLSLGFEYIDSSEDDTMLILYFTDYTLLVGFGVIDQYIAVSITVLDSGGPSDPSPTTPPSNPGSPKMYTSYPSVPDFGAFSGAKLVESYTLKPSEGVGVIYLYDIKSTTAEKLNGYADLLISLGFEYIDSSESDTMLILYFTDYTLLVGFGVIDQYIAVTIMVL